MHNTKVIILGGGVAGIAAAKQLIEHGINDFLVLEGESRVGGRMKESELNGSVIELGANWLANINAPDNSIWPLAQEIKLKGGTVGSYVPNESCYFDATSNRFLYPTEAQKVEDNIDLVYSKISEIAIDRWNQRLPDLPMSEVLSLIDWKAEGINFPSESTTLFTRLLEPNGISDFKQLSLYTAMGAFYQPFIDVHNPEKITSKKNFEEVMNHLSPEFFVYDQRGFASIIRHIIQKHQRLSKNIILNNRVKIVNYLSSPIRIIAFDEVEKRQIIYSCEHVICTFSAGVLKSNNVSFVPQLSKPKRDALNLIEMGSYTKIFIQFDRDFWSHMDFQFLLYSDSDPLLQVYRSWYNLKHYYPHMNLLLIVVPGQNGEKVERQDPQITQTHILSCLTKMFGDSVPKPIGFLVNNWIANPFTLGSYSNMSPGFNVRHLEDLARPENNLYLAGEIFGWPDNGYVHTAFASGLETAHRVISKIRITDRSRL